MPRITLIVSTRKGLWLYRSADRARWEADGPHHFGCLVHHAVLDTRDGRTLLAEVLPVATELATALPGVPRVQHTVLLAPSILVTPTLVPRCHTVPPLVRHQNPLR